MKELCEEFSEVLFKRKPSINLYSFDELNWFNGVLESLKGSSRNDDNFDYKKLKKEELSLSVFKILNSFPHDSNKVDNWYKEKIEKLSKDENLTIGRSQKLINLLIKYHIGFYYVKNDSNELCERLNRNINLLHIPIDSIILKYTNLLFRDEDLKLKEILTSIHYLKTIEKESCWSKLNEYDSYEIFQKYIRTKSKQYGVTPIEFEMRFLWKSEKDLIKHYFQFKLKRTISI